MITFSCFLEHIYSVLTFKMMIMDDKNLTILPCRNHEKAEKVFKTLLFDEAYLLVVLGAGETDPQKTDIKMRTERKIQKQKDKLDKIDALAAVKTKMVEGGY